MTTCGYAHVVLSGFLSSNGVICPYIAKRTCNGFVLQMAHFYSKKSIVKKSLQNITK